MTAEWSVVNSRALFDENRLDAEFFRPRYLQVEQTLRALKALDVAHYLVDIRYGLNVPPEYVENGLPFVRALNLKEYGIEGEILNIPFTAEQVGEDNLLKEGDLLIVRSGANVGDLGVVVGPLIGSTFGSYVIRMRVKGIDPFYLYVYLKSTFGREQTVRFRSGAAQPNISIPNLRRVLVAKPSEQHQREIKDLLFASYQKRSEAERVYAEAEALLLAELGLDDIDLTGLQDPSGLAYTQSFSQVWASGRLDAEYSQPKHYTLLAKLQETGQAVRLGDWLTEPVRRGVQPKYDENGTVVVINSRHIGKTHVEVESTRRTTRGFAEQNKRAVVRPYDVLLNSTGYITIGRCQTLLDNVLAIVDGHVSIIRPKPGLDPVYLGLFLNSLPGQMQTERSWTGSSGQIELRSGLIEHYTVWKPDEAFQRQIRSFVEEAHTARREAKRLLEEAKQWVEEMVLGEES